MKPKDRRTGIAKLLEQSGEMTVDDLARHFDVSPETMRRDLGQMAEEGMIQKVHGGARALGRTFVEDSFQARMQEEPLAKSVIAEKLCAVIRSGDTVMMDTGSTTVIAAERLAQVPALKVITNSLSVADIFGRHMAQSGTELFLLGGSYAPGNHQTVGPDAIAQLDLYRADHSVSTVTAVAAAEGATNSNVHEAHLARAMIARAQNVIVLAHAAKFGRRAAFRVCGFERMDMLISDRRPEGALAHALDRAGVAVR
ncbi:DeoR/GlpR family DNA-binding transcription regulator [Mangrovicoccus algicola]|uniref:DeoR/GlpR transcriptional regulator n=1 Tax=Mangrovicoccus algicola TaxID=2771008 RepID=A0A8J7CIP7_9RHOB|nr:DeoR/GlpR family DNA-binding transcription regulator [Mangrovicoccus algicola]MBE3639855.1 DeoR/GlpR transcriptional regulator [Mangrovicoccus algicola]